jgi:hypothetical protein
MAIFTPKLSLQTAVEELGKYFGALEMSAFYDLLTSHKNFDPQAAQDTVEYQPTNIAGQLCKYLYDVTQGGLTVVDLLQEAKAAGYKGTVAGGDQAVEVAADAATASTAAKVEGGAENIFNNSLLFTYEDTGDGLPGLNAFSVSQGWSKSKDPDGSHIFSIRDITGADVNKNEKAPPTKSDPGLTVTQVFDPRLSIANHAANAIQVFMNAIPAMEFSRCVPYFNLQMISGMNQLDVRGRPQTPSLFQFLYGSLPTDAGTTDRLIADARNVNIFESGEAEMIVDEATGAITTPATAGMELFTSPQTLVNAAETHTTLTPSNEQGAFRSAPVLDRFRPLMSITKFSVDIQPTQQLIAFKTANISFVLHDRSRLGEVAQFVKPDLYRATELLIEYGWSHPDGLLTSATSKSAFSADNAFGAFLNSLRCREKYAIKNSKFSFNDDGSVGIDVELSMKGGTEVSTTSIAKGEGVEAVLVEIDRLNEAIQNAQKKVNREYAKDVSGFQVLNSVTDTAAMAGIDKDTLKELKKFYTSTKGSSELKGINDGLVAIWGPSIDGSGGQIKNLQNTIAAAVAAKQKKLITGDDPFLRKLSFSAVGKSKAAPSVNRAGKKKRQYVSLGKLLLLFCGAPLAETNRFDEVQFIFYPFNSKASYMHDFNIAQFPVHIDTFVQKFAELKKITANLPIQSFMNFMNKEFLSTQDTHAYGLFHTFTGKDNNRTRTKAYEKLTALADEKKRIFQDAYGENADPSFRMPFIKVVLECVPVNYKMAPEAGVSSSAERSLLRIHVMDAAATPHEGMTSMLQATRSSNLGYINGLASKSKDSDIKSKKRTLHQKQFQDTLLEALREELLEAVPTFAKPDPAGEFADRLSENKLTLRIKGGFSALKQFVSRGMPSVMIGSQNSAVISAKLSSMNDPQISTIMMLDSGPRGGDVAQGARDAGLPMQMSPTELSVDTFGCPLFQLGQQYFFDFQTGTNVDNIYTISGISHSFGPGEYKTSIKLMNAQSFGVYRQSAANIADALQAIADNAQST